MRNIIKGAAVLAVLFLARSAFGHGHVCQNWLDPGYAERNHDSQIVGEYDADMKVVWDESGLYYHDGWGDVYLFAEEIPVNDCEIVLLIVPEDRILFMQRQGTGEDDSPRVYLVAEGKLKMFVEPPKAIPLNGD